MSICDAQMQMQMLRRAEHSAVAQPKKERADTCPGRLACPLGDAMLSRDV
jgi:hypothetical protein